MAADGVLMPLEEGTSAFITMNPGYIGRAELPESLKARHSEQTHPMLCCIAMVHLVETVRNCGAMLIGRCLLNSQC